MKQESKEETGERRNACKKKQVTRGNCTISFLMGEQGRLIPMDTRLSSLAPPSYPKASKRLDPVCAETDGLTDGQTKHLIKSAYSASPRREEGEELDKDRRNG